MHVNQVWRRRWIVLMATCVLSTLAVQPVAARPAAQSGPPARNPSMVYLPLVAMYESPATPAPDDRRVFGLIGRLTEAADETFATYFITTAGARYALVGESADVEERILALAAASALATVKVWGTIADQALGTSLPLIVVTGVLPAEIGTTGVVGPVVAAPFATVRYNLINLHGGPGPGFGRVGQVILNQICDIVGRNVQSSWWQLRCYDGQAGWVDRRLVNAQGDIWRVAVVQVVVATPTPAPAPQPAATATPPAAADPGWHAAFYNNTSLSGPPVAVVNVGNVSFNWGAGSPAPAVPADYFSARFTRTMDLASGYYRFTAEADDGIRVWLDDQLLIDEWHGATGRVYSVNRNIAAGRRTLNVEYYEAAGTASIRFRHEPMVQAPVWRVEYFSGIDLFGTPGLVRFEPESQRPLDYNWRYGPPVEAPTIGADYWSARWTGRFRFDQGNYVVQVMADDGIRVYLNELLVIDAWRDGYKELSNRIIGIGAGDHTVRVEVYDRTGIALARVWWWKEAASVE